jgi:hypothetical protein
MTDKAHAIFILIMTGITLIASIIILYTSYKNCERLSDYVTTEKDLQQMQDREALDRIWLEK